MSDQVNATAQTATAMNATAGAPAAGTTISTGAPSTPSAAPAPAPAPAGQPAGAASAAAPQAPVEIAAKDLALPQGFEPAAAEQVAGMAKAMGWSKDQAQKYLDHAAAQAPAAQAARAQAQAQQTKGWHDAIAADPVFGGQAFEGTKINAKRGIDALVKAGHLSQEDIAFLDSSGYGNHPILVKIAASFGKSLGEDTFGGRNAGGGQGTKSDADTFYGN